MTTGDQSHLWPLRLRCFGRDSRQGAGTGPSAERAATNFAARISTPSAATFLQLVAAVQTWQSRYQLFPWMTNESTTIDESMQRFNTLRDYMAVGGVAIAQELRMVMRNLGFKHSNEERNSWERSCSVHFDVYRIYSDIWICAYNICNYIRVYMWVYEYCMCVCIYIYIWRFSKMLVRNF